MFPLNNIAYNTRNPEKYHVSHANTKQLAKSAIPYMQRLLNNQFYIVCLGFIIIDNVNCTLLFIVSQFEIQSLSLSNLVIQLSYFLTNFSKLATHGQFHDIKFMAKYIDKIKSCIPIILDQIIFFSFSNVSCISIKDQTFVKFSLAIEETIQQVLNIKHSLTMGLQIQLIYI